MANEVASSPTALSANAFTRTGYTFSASTALYAQWTTVPTYTVTFNGNGSTGGSMANESASVATALSANAYTRTGYTFTGWNTAANATGTAYANGASYPFSASTTLYAQWTTVPTYTVTFNGNGSTGGSMANESASVATALSANAFTRTGYTFTGWNTAANATGTAYANGASYPFSASTTLYAQWTTVPTYTVTFNGNGSTGGSMANESASVATALSANAFTRTGYTFTGWNTAANATGTAYANGASYPFSASTTLYAQWTTVPTYTVTFNGNGSTGGSMANESASVATALSANAFTRTGYTFTGWNTAANATGTAYANGASYPFSASTTLYAQWTTVPTYTVTFNGNGSTGGSMANESASVATALSANAFTRTGYTFTGWNTAANATGTAYANGASYPFSASTTLYAQWTTVPTYTVTFNGNGSTGGSMANESASVATALSANAFTRTGYTFTGWNTAANATGTAYANGASYPFSASTTLYAQWTTVPTYTVTFNGNGSTGGSMANEVASVATALSANAFTRTGYTFTGWNTAANATGTAYATGASYPFSASTTLYAQWTTVPTYTVTFNGNGSTGGSMANESASVATALSANAFTRTGYTFTGWITAANATGTAYANGASYPFSASTTLYAQWSTAANFSVTFNGN